MHIIIGALGSIASILWIFHRLALMGIDLGGLNPFLWQRRRRWKKKYETNPVYTLEKPMEAAALVLTATAKVTGEISSEEKRELLKVFETEFHVTKLEAAGLLASSIYLIGKGDEIRDDLGKVLAPSAPNFSPEQAESVVHLAHRVAEAGGEPTDVQKAFLASLAKHFSPDSGMKPKWA